MATPLIVCTRCLNRFLPHFEQQKLCQSCRLKGALALGRQDAIAGIERKMTDDVQPSYRKGWEQAQADIRAARKEESYRHDRLRQRGIGFGGGYRR